MFFEIDKLLGGNYKSFICFLKSSNYWVANKLTVTKVSYVFLEIDKLSGGQKLTITTFRMFFPKSTSYWVANYKVCYVF